VTSIVSLSLLLILLLGTRACLFGTRGGQRTLEVVSLPFGHAAVRERAGRLELVFSSSQLIQSAVTLKNPQRSALLYTSGMHLAAALARPLNRALFIGAGGCVLPSEFAAAYPNLEIQIVELYPEILNLARQYFRLQPTPRLHPIVGDGRVFLESSTNAFDCIVVDAFENGIGTPGQFTDASFFELALSRMRQNSVFCMNVCYDERRSSGGHEATVNEFARVFGRENSICLEVPWEGGDRSTAPEALVSVLLFGFHPTRSATREPRDVLDAVAAPHRSSVARLLGGARSSAA
jgi:hypothetical protein